MEKVLVSDSKIEGALEAPPSKSATHRALAAAALAPGTSELSRPLVADDTLATASALCALGFQVQMDNRTARVKGGRPKPAPSPVDCGASGTTLRIVCALAALADGKTEITGTPVLMSRPHEPLARALEKIGAKVDLDKNRIVVRGKAILDGGEVELPNNVSSQFVTALLFVAPFTRKGIRIKLPAPLESSPYAAMTVSVMRGFGVRAEMNDNATFFSCDGGQSYGPRSISVEGDWSSAAFLLAAAAISGEAEVTGLNPESLQPDRAIVRALGKCGASVETNSRTVKVATPGKLRAFEFDVTDSPDLFPVLAALAAASEGESRLTGIARNRLKESDRVHAMARGLSNLGFDVKEKNDEFFVRGGGPFHGEIDSLDDHRIAMAFAVLGPASEKGVSISDPHVVEKSYPGFFEDLASLGARVSRSGQSGQ